ncbi:MAG: tyrosine--tRNA ligase [Candidatus Melainabacteria bacterium]
MAPTDTAAPVQAIFLEQARALVRGGELLPGGVETLARRLQHSAETQTPLKVKLGLDPTRPDLHLGHAVVLKKFRAFQDLGHDGILIIGDATAMIGDPSGRSATRPPLSEEEVEANAQTYLDQAGKIIDVRKAKVVRNSAWLSPMCLGDFLKLAAKATVAQILVREDFAKRYAENKPISLHELFYPLMQGFDSVEVEADIELGGSDQRFNNLMGRELQEAYARKHPQLVLLMPLLEGTDGKVKMSKSYPDHCINLLDTPADMYGKLMSIPDEMIARYELLLGLLTEAQLEEQQKNMRENNMNPRDVKMHLARYIVGTYHTQQLATEAETAFVNQFQKKQIPDDIPEAQLQANTPLPLMDLIVAHQLAVSKNEAKRLLEGGGVKIDGEKIASTDYQIQGAPGATFVLQVGKRKFLKLNF